MEYYSCKCGAVVKRADILPHLGSRKHRQKNMSPLYCEICCEDDGPLHKCPACSQKFCNICKVKMWQCPYCRLEYAPRPEPEPYYPEPEFIPNPEEPNLLFDIMQHELENVQIHIDWNRYAT